MSISPLHFLQPILQLVTFPVFTFSSVSSSSSSSHAPQNKFSLLLNHSKPLFSESNFCSPIILPLVVAFSPQCGHFTPSNRLINTLTISFFSSVLNLPNLNLSLDNLNNSLAFSKTFFSSSVN